jgi:hypothetical protein
MNRDEYNTLFHKLELNLVAFKRLMDCDEEVLKLVNAAIAAERERIKWDSIHTCNPHCDRPACVAVRRAREDEREMCAKVADALTLPLLSAREVRHDQRRSMASMDEKIHRLH